MDKGQSHQSHGYFPFSEQHNSVGVHTSQKCFSLANNQSPGKKIIQILEYYAQVCRQINDSLNVSMDTQ